jgi:hypothetical protein
MLRPALISLSTVVSVALARVAITSRRVWLFPTSLNFKANYPISGLAVPIQARPLLHKRKLTSRCSRHRFLPPSSDLGISHSTYATPFLIDRPLFTDDFLQVNFHVIYESETLAGGYVP